MAGTGAVPGWLARAAAETEGKKKILVAVFLRGAADGLNIVAPFGDKRYRELRPSIGIQAPGGPNGAIDLDGQFGLHPQLQPLKALWDKQQLAIIEATGSPDPSRSHFDAQDYMELGTPGKTSSDGWMNRSLDPAGPKTSPLRAIAMGGQLPRTLRGNQSAVAVNDAQTFQMGNADSGSIFEKMYASAADKRLNSTGKDAFAAMKMIQSINQSAPFNQATAQQYGLGGGTGTRYPTGIPFD